MIAPALALAALVAGPAVAEPGATTTATATATATSVVTSAPAPRAPEAPRTASPEPPSTTRDAEALQWRLSFGGELAGTAHGVVDVGVRFGPWRAQLFTDTLDLRWGHELGDGRVELGARGQFFAGGMMIDPWTAGAPDPARRRVAAYASVDGEYVRYLGHGLYARGALTLREWFFVATDTTRIALPDPTFIASPELTLGWWRPDVELTATAGADLGQNGAAPRARLFFRYTPEARVGPRIELRAGLAHGQDDLTKTRLGGLNPYVVPLAGAAWAELWVERYVALRAGPRATLGPVELSLVADLAWVDDGRRLFGVAALTRVGLDALVSAPWFVEASVGYAPELPRPTDLGRYGVWVLVGRSWGG